MDKNTSILDIKKRSQPGIVGEDGRFIVTKGHWYNKILTRKISIYFTWFFLKTNVSPNIITILMILCGILGFLFMIHHSIYNAIIGYIFMTLYLILDCSDGEVARYNNQTSVKGFFLDLLGSVFYYHFSRIIPPIHIYIITYNPLFLLIGFISYSLSCSEHLTRKSYVQAYHGIELSLINKKSIYYLGYGFIGKIFRLIIFLSKQINDPVIYNSVSFTVIIYGIIFSNINSLIYLSYIYIAMSCFILFNTLIKCYIDLPAYTHQKKD